MSSTIEILWKQALKTFGSRNSVGYRFCQKNFEILRSIMNKVTAADVGLAKEMLNSVEMQPAPMCVIDIFENQDITIAIFILKQGVTMPMHDHPEMHGLLKVIAGTVEIDSFTLEISGDNILKSKTGYTAIKHPGLLVKDTDEACVLLPREKNIHQISSIEGPAAFLDILSPPYDGEEFGNTRPCTFFRITGSMSSTEPEEKLDKVHLVPSSSPCHFFSTSLEYLGPPLR